MDLGSEEHVVYIILIWFQIKDVSGTVAQWLNRTLKVKEIRVRSVRKGENNNGVKPDGLAYRDEVIGDELRTKILAFLEEIPEDEWEKLKGSTMATRKRRIGYGRALEKSIPTELRGLLPAILASIMESMNDVEKTLLKIFENEYRFTINRYVKNMGLGLHFDTQADKDAIVIGFTIGSKKTTSRSMLFEKDGTLEMHSVLTRDNSVYIFYGNAYTDWKHGSSPPTDGIVYSITIRANC